MRRRLVGKKRPLCRARLLGRPENHAIVHRAREQHGSLRIRARRGEPAHASDPCVVAHQHGVQRHGPPLRGMRKRQPVFLGVDALVVVGQQLGGHALKGVRRRPLDAGHRLGLDAPHAHIVVLRRRREMHVVRAAAHARRDAKVQRTYPVLVPFELEAQRKLAAGLARVQVHFLVGECDGHERRQGLVAVREVGQGNVQRVAPPERNRLHDVGLQRVAACQFPDLEGVVSTARRKDRRTACDRHRIAHHAERRDRGAMRALRRDVAAPRKCALFCDGTPHLEVAAVRAKHQRGIRVRRRRRFEHVHSVAARRRPPRRRAGARHGGRHESFVYAKDVRVLFRILTT